VWVGWEFDVRRVNGLMAITVPSAQGIDAMVWGDFTPSNTNDRQTVGDLVGYVPSDPAAADSTLTVRDSQFATPQAIERPRWSLENGLVVLKDGFQAGRIYRVSYRARSLPISGLGLAAFRDTASWVSTRPAWRREVALAFGSSQSGRFAHVPSQRPQRQTSRDAVFTPWMHRRRRGARRERAGATPTSLTIRHHPLPHANGDVDLISAARTAS
jgi:hypothetical protein